MSINGKMDLSDNEKYLLSLITTLMTTLRTKNLITIEEIDEIVDIAKTIFYKKMSEEHQGFGI